MMAVYTGKKLTPAERKEKEASLIPRRACNWEALSQIPFGWPVVIEDRIEGTEERCWIYMEKIKTNRGHSPWTWEGLYKFVHVDGGRCKLIKEKDLHKYFIAPIDDSGGTKKGWDPNDEQ